jgi:hypothetical protein
VVRSVLAMLELPQVSAPPESTVGGGE